MECFQVRYDSRVVIYERKLFIRLATGLANYHNFAYFLVFGNYKMVFGILSVLNYSFFWGIWAKFQCKWPNVEQII